MMNRLQMTSMKTRVLAILLFAGMALYPVAILMETSAYAVGGPSTIAHQAGDVQFDKPFTVRCRGNGKIVVIKEGQSSKQKCPGNGAVDRLITSKHQIVRCKSGTIKFDFGNATTHIIRSGDGPYTGCKTIYTES